MSFGENWFDESHSSLKGKLRIEIISVIYIYIYIYIYRLTWVKFGIEDLHIMSLSMCELCENRCSGSHCLFVEVNENLPAFSILLT